MLSLNKFVALLLSTPALAQEFVHRRKIPYNPDRPSARELIIQKYARQEETLTSMLEQRKASIEEHESGRKLLSDQELEQHQNHINNIKRKLAIHRNKDPKVLQLEIEEEIKLYEKMMEGEFLWTSEGLVLKEP